MPISIIVQGVKGALKFCLIVPLIFIVTTIQILLEIGIIINKRLIWIIEKLNNL